MHFFIEKITVFSENLLDESFFLCSIKMRQNDKSKSQNTINR